MTAEIVVGLLTAGALGAVGYTMYLHRERARWAGIRKDQMEKLKQLKRLKWHKRKIG